MADALSRRYALLSTLDAKLLGFEHIKELYANDQDFGNVLMHVKRVCLVSFIGIMGFI